jgi:hypothetical protein
LTDEERKHLRRSAGVCGVSDKILTFWLFPVIEMLLNTTDLKINARNANGLIPLNLAAMYNDNPDIITMLINKGADIRIRQKYPLS